LNDVSKSTARLAALLLLAGTGCSSTDSSSPAATASAGGAAGASAGAGGSTAGSSSGGTGGVAGAGAGGAAGTGGSSVGGGGTGAGGDPTTATYNTLPIPVALTGTTFDLSLAKSQKALQPGAATATYGYNGADFWGPTLVFNKGDVVKLNVANQLTEDTTTHWHGLHIPAVMDGGPHQIIPAGTTWSPSFTVMNKAATYWYHPHLHTKTAAQLTYGAGGFIIIRDPEEAALALPRTYGVDDIPVVFSSRRFLSGNQFDTTAVYGDYVVANGALRPKVTLPSQVVRLRILNAEIERAYNLGFSDGRTFHVIGTDGGLVDAPIPVTKLKLYVGERVEILVDLSKDASGSAVDLQAFNGGFPLGFPGGEPGTTGMFGSLLNDKTFDLLHIEVGDKTAGAITAIPTKLVSNVLWTDADATSSRTLHVTDKGPGTPFTFDNVAFDANVINQMVTLGSTEKWTITNDMVFDHSFHIHDVQFAIVSRSDGPVADYEKGWKDTLRIPRSGSVSFVARFDDFASATNPYMYHCHMSDHEDTGLMGQFLVQ
jgi:bilirubin oxidase